MLSGTKGTHKNPKEKCASYLHKNKTDTTDTPIPCIIVLGIKNPTL